MKLAFESLVSEIARLKMHNQGENLIEGLEHLIFKFAEQGDLKFLDLLEGKKIKIENLIIKY